MNEYFLLVNKPRELFDFYINQMLSNIILTQDQKIKFEYLKKLYIVGYTQEEENGD